MEYVDWVRLAGRRMPLAEVRADPDAHVRLLAAARTNKSAECLCRAPGLRLVTRCNRSGRHNLAVWPGEGPRHDPRCAFHRLDPAMTGRAAYESSAICETDTGVLIRFAAPLTSEPTRPGQAGGEASGAGVGRRAVGLLGLLHSIVWKVSRQVGRVCAGRNPP